MIKSLSPYYVYIPFVSPLTGLTCTNYTLKLFVWDGMKDEPPATPSYEFTKSNPTNSIGNDEIDISNLINDFIDFTPKKSTITELLTGDNQLWVKWVTFYITTDVDDLTTPTNVNTVLMLKGYSYGMDGANQSIPTNKILLSGNEFKVSRFGSFVLPISIDESSPISYEIFLDYITYNSSTPTQANMNIYYTIPVFTPTDVIVQISPDNIVFTDEYTLTNSAPLTNVLIDYPLGGSTYVRLKITESMVDYFSNSVNVGLV